MGFLLVPIPQLKKPRPREVKELTQSCSAGSTTSGFEFWGVRLQSPFFELLCNSGDAQSCQQAAVRVHRLDLRDGRA
jgi:hypothetical protein